MIKKFGLLGCLILALALAPLFGSADINPIAGIVGSEPVAKTIFWNLRLPRVILAGLAGASLGVAGCVFQALFRNNLASPYTLGVASSASFGAVLFLKSSLLGGVATGMNLGVGIGALIGAFFSIIPISLLRGLKAELLIICGLVLAFFFSSLTILVQSLSSLNESYSMIRWMMGGVETLSWGYLGLTSFFCLGLMAFIWRGARVLDLLFMGDEFSQAKGIDVRSERRKYFILTSLLIALIVACCGPIGFVGIIVPNLCRILFGARMSSLIPLSAASSAIFLIACDTLARTILGPSVIPVGVVTALIGTPIFALLIVRKGL